jgi:ABC-type lipoprotein export system ATPase subunit
VPRERAAEEECVVTAESPAAVAEVADRGVSAAPVVDVRDAFCLHPIPGAGSVAALRGLTLAVAPGERVVVHGPNGSGKTTLLGVLSGERRLSAGTATVAGLDPATASARELAAWRSRALGRVDQDPRRTLRSELDVLANVALHLRLAGRSRREAEDVALAALERLRLAHLAARRPDNLSGGEAQRVAVCAALAHRPTLVLADEPTGELDAEAAADVYDALAAAVADAGATLVLVSHDRRAARVADRVVRIRDGRLSETWRPSAPDAAESPQELLVVDDRGWLRLPDVVRRAAGIGERVRVRMVGDAVSLDPEPGTAVAPVAPELPAPSAAAPAAEGTVATLRGIELAYGDRPVLRGLDLDVVAGRLLTISGPSGSGKSTLLRVLSGLERPDAGDVTVRGTALDTCDRDALAALRAADLAVVTQDVHLAGATTAEANLELARAVRHQPSDADADARRLGDLGLAALAHRPVDALSGGERQRVAVARALVVSPRLVVLDEPTSQLDEASAERLAAVLVAAAREGAAVVVATHDPVLLEAADDVLHLG